MMRREGARKKKLKPMFAGRRYDSEREAIYASSLRADKQDGLIKDVEFDVPFKLAISGKPTIIYKATFLVTHPDGGLEVHELRETISTKMRATFNLFELLHPSIPIRMLGSAVYESVWSGKRRPNG